MQTFDYCTSESFKLKYVNSSIFIIHISDFTFTDIQLACEIVQNTTPSVISEVSKGHYAVQMEAKTEGGCSRTKQNYMA